MRPSPTSEVEPVLLAGVEDGSASAPSLLASSRPPTADEVGEVPQAPRGTSPSARPDVLAYGASAQGTGLFTAGPVPITH